MEDVRVGLENRRFGKGDACLEVMFYSFRLSRYSIFRPSMVAS